MHVRRFPSFAILLCAVAACASGRRAEPILAPTTPARAQADVERVLSILESVLDFKAVKRERYDDPAAGVRVLYETANGLGADVFVYPVDDAAKDTSLDQRRSTAMAEAGTALLGIQMYIERGVYTDVIIGEAVKFEVASPSGYVVPGVHIPVSLRVDGIAKHSDVIVLDMHGVFIKLRATYPMPLADAGARAKVRELATTIAAALESGVAKPVSVQRVPPGKS